MTNIVDADTKVEEVSVVKEDTDNVKKVNLDDMQIAYVVGLSPEGEFIFEVYGKDKGIIQLLGINQHAIRKIESIYNDSQGFGDRITVEVGKAVASLHQKVDQVVSVVVPKKPANQL